MTLFGPVHLALLLGISLLAVALVLGCRQRILDGRIVCTALGIAIAINELAWWYWRYSREGVRTTNLPLQLCDALVWASVVACMTRAAWLAEFTYFAGIAAAGMALLTPDLVAPWPAWPAIYFFLAHGGIVTVAVLMAFGKVIRFEPVSVWRPFGTLLLFAFLVGCIDAATGANYMYLGKKPGGASVLDQMGPWPFYILPGAVLGLLLFWILWLPVRPTRLKANM